MPIKGPGTDAVFATYITPYEPSKPCQNTNMKVIFSGEGILKGEICMKSDTRLKKELAGYSSLSKIFKK